MNKETFDLPFVVYSVMKPVKVQHIDIAVEEGLLFNGKESVV